MEDITPKLLSQIRKDFQEMLDKSNLITKLYARVRDGTATYTEANDFAIEVGKILAKAYGNNLSSDVLPEGKMFYNIAQRIIVPTMKNNYTLITNVTKQVQKSLNVEAGIGIKPIIPKLNEDRIRGIVDRVSNEDIFDDIKWILDEPVVNFSQSIVDDSIKTNAEFHYKAGMRPRIVRKISGNCCEWCRAIAGTYYYDEELPDDIYRRHQRCRCTVEYFIGNGKVENVHTKKVRNETVLEKSLNRERKIAKEIQAAKFKRTFMAVPQNQVVNVMRKDSRKWIDSLSEEDIRCIQKYTLNEIEESPKFYERLNAMLRGDIPENDNLRYYANIISNALKKSTLGENVICYRGMDVNPIQNAEIGQFTSLYQFISTAVSSARSFDKQVKVVIYAKKGTKGVAYIEKISKMPRQREMLFDKDCIYKVLSNSKELIELEVI